ncbi:P-loop containing nucleoside triphosphate hydrolase protein [Xylaria cf. heliscus]|nr:P-loop containing nucleoside triphosphate hydrolase protein [Xylaria cf. heliscus]
MATTNLRNFLALTGASQLPAIAGANALDMLEVRVPGFKVMQRFFKTWLKIDLTSLAFALALFGTMSSGMSMIKDLGAYVWTYIARFFVSSISVSGHDKLNEEVLNWLADHVLPYRQPRILNAQYQESNRPGSWNSYRNLAIKDDNKVEKRNQRLPIFYMPAFGSIWFIHDRNFFILRRVDRYGNSDAVDYFYKVSSGQESLVVMCLGRSPEPIKRLFKTCQQYIDDRAYKYVKVHEVCHDSFPMSWKTPELCQRRPLETVHFDRAMKDDLVADIATYHSDECRMFYRSRGIPYRRGYLLYGPPGTGKTSLCIALASHFDVEIYFLHIPSVSRDDDIRSLFKDLPTHCFVVLEDIDAIGLRDPAYSSSSSRKKCTLSGLLNVLDGINSHEGRIILMTTNFIDRLDAALIRPGRIDKRVYLGKLGQSAAKEMFLRLFKTDEDEGGSTPATATNTNTDSSSSSSSSSGSVEKKLDAWAEEFSRRLPAEQFTPAQVQGYLLENRGLPSAAVSGVEAWAEKKALEIKLEEEVAARKKAKAEAKAKAKVERRKGVRRRDSMVDLIRSVIREDREKTGVEGGGDKLPGEEVDGTLVEEEMMAQEIAEELSQESGDESDAESSSEEER